jgi:CspA family cold shock protein
MSIRGIVKWFNTTRNYGFITNADTKEEVFLHGTEVTKSGIDSLDKGDVVEYEIGPAPKTGANMAVNIVKAD